MPETPEIRMIPTRSRPVTLEDELNFRRLKPISAQPSSVKGLEIPKGRQAIDVYTVSTNGSEIDHHPEDFDPSVMVVRTRNSPGRRGREVILTALLTDLSAFRIRQIVERNLRMEEYQPFNQFSVF